MRAEYSSGTLRTGCGERCMKTYRRPVDKVDAADGDAVRLQIYPVQLIKNG